MAKQQQSPTENSLSPAEELRFDLYVDAVGDAASRSRSIIAVLMTATFITALAFFNALLPSLNWLSSRQTSLQCAYHWITFVEDTSSEAKPIRIPASWFTGPEKIRLPNKNYPTDTSSTAYTVHKNAFEQAEFLNILLNSKLIAPKDTKGLKPIPEHIRLHFPPYAYDNPDRILTIFDLDKNETLNVVKTIAELTVVSQDDLKNQITYFERARIENSILINIPVLGISFDVNNLAIISAAAFSILFFLLFYNLARERKNLILVFKYAEQKNINKTSLYQLLSMRMVLMVPHSIDEYITGEEPDLPGSYKTKMLPWLPRFPMHLAVCVWSVVFIYDLYTSFVGASINPTLTYVQYIVSIILGLIMLNLFLWCRNEWKEISKIWEIEAKNIGKQIKTSKSIP